LGPPGSSIQIGCGTVSNYLSRAHKAGLSLPCRAVCTGYCR